MKYAIIILCVIALSACSKAPQPELAKLEAKVAQLELELANTKTFIMAMEGSQTASEAVVKTQGEIIQQLATSTDTEQLKTALTEYMELSRKRDEIVDQKMAILAKQVFGEAEAAKRGLIYH